MDDWADLGPQRRLADELSGQLGSPSIAMTARGGHYEALADGVICARILRPSMEVMLALRSTARRCFPQK